MMKLDNHETTLLIIAAVGVATAIGKLFSGGEKITLRLLAGRVIIGGGLSMSAGTLLAFYPDLHPVALVGAASAVGILGQNFIENLIQRYFSQREPEK